MANNISTVQLAPTGLAARLFGTSVTSGGTTYYYWIQALYPGGYSALSGSVSVANCPATLSKDTFVEINWNPMPGAIAYALYRTTTSTAPTLGVNQIFFDSSSNYKDAGFSFNSAALGIVQGNIQVARGHYDFAIDGAGVAASALAFANSDTIPKGAIILAVIVNPTTNITGPTNVGIGTSAGSSGTALYASTAIATINAGVTLGAVNFASPIKMTAAGTMTVTPTVAVFSAGVFDVIVLYTLGLA